MSRLTVRYADDAIVLEVLDDGPGSVGGGGTGNGLVGMRERVALLGGAIEIESGTSGTSVRIEVPFP